jgi:hypothetical protein
MRIFRSDSYREVGFGRIRSRALPAILGVAILLGTTVFVSTAQEKWAGSRSTPVHRIPLKDENNQPIVPTESNPLPFSARYTCAPCHNYETIKAGWHFNASSPAAPSGRPGEPWIWVDERTGTQIPISERSWKGVFKPADLGLSSWDFSLLFGRHLPGGGPAEPADEAMTPASRWSVSGKAEINCLGCHNAAKVQNHSEWAKQILRENFRWAATAAAGLGEVGGIASRLAPTWDVFDGANPDDSEWAVAPSVKYDRTLFDSKHRAFLDIAYPPNDEGCLACHSTAPTAMKKFAFDDDIHRAAGISCASCHRNDVSHAMIRGYAGEAKDNPALLSEDFTCEACHLGGNGETPGRMGAPYPRHKGIPEVHFKRVSCTACHSGPLPEKEPARVRTARANRLGIFGAADWSTDLPSVVEPVFKRDTNGKITPHRMMWPAYWGVLENETVRPIRPEVVQAAAGAILYPEKTVTRILAALMNAADRQGTPVLVLDGKTYEPNLDGGLTAKPYPGNQPAAGPFWASVKDGVVTPLVPDFDPANAEAAAEPDAAIQKLLEALRAAEAAPGEPAAVIKGYIYKLVDGTLEKTERKATAPAVSNKVEWIWVRGEETLPFLPEFEKAAVMSLTGTDHTLTEAQVTRGLEILARNGTANPVYISGGKLLQLDDKGLLKAADHPAAEPVAWPLAHQVRPARQALGFNGCTDCHRIDSNFFFSTVEAQGPLQSTKISRRSGTTFMGLDHPYHRLFGLSFIGRPYFKIVLGIAAFAIGAILLAALVFAVGRVSGLIEKRR